MVESNNEFVCRLADALNEDHSAVNESSVLTDFEGWDSVGQLAIIALIDEFFNRRINVDALRKCRYVSDVLNLSRGNNEI